LELTFTSDEATIDAQVSRPRAVQRVLNLVINFVEITAVAVSVLGDLDQFARVSAAVVAAGDLGELGESRQTQRLQPSPFVGRSSIFVEGLTKGKSAAVLFRRLSLLVVPEGVLDSCGDALLTRVGQGLIGGQ